MATTRKTAISTTRGEDFAEWYQRIVKEADLAENSSVRGCMIIKPWGYGIWERLQQDLDRRIKETGHVNCYFPLFIPLHLIQKEAAHVEGFAKEMAVVTHHRVELDENGKLVPASPLEEPLVVRPTSETIIGEALSNWIKSYRDLPLLLNQWANVVRWEMRPRLFLRTSEFLWQEGHTAHETQPEAEQETQKMLDVYADTMADMLAMPTIKGEKSPGERFPGAVSTLSVEAMMQDGRALQAGTSHYLGQNFAKAAGIRFQTRDKNLEYVFTTSWGVSTRLIGGLIMTHGDDNGLRLPPRVAPHQVVVIPILRDKGAEVISYCDDSASVLRSQDALGAAIRCFVDKRDISPQEKRWEWVRKGVPLVCEIGPRDMESSQITYTYRNDPGLSKRTEPRTQFYASCPQLLEALHGELYASAGERLQSRTNTSVRTWEDLVDYFADDEAKPYEERPGFVRAACSLSAACENRLKDIGVSIRNIPSDQTQAPGICVVTGEPTTQEVILAKAY